MPSNTFEEVAITASVTVVPSKVRKFEEEVDLFDGNTRQIERLKKTIGFDQRRIADASVTALDLSFQASVRLLEALKMSPNEIDRILFVTQTSDHSQPSNASLIHKKLGGHSECAAFDINLGCSGYVYGLWVAYGLISSGACERILLLSGDTLSQMVHPKDKATAPLFGDAGSASLVEKKIGAGTSWFRIGSNGNGSDALIVPAGGARLPATEATAEESADSEGNVRTQVHLHMDGASVFNFSIEVVPNEIEALLATAQLDVKAVDYFILHQANRYIVQTIGKRLGVDRSKLPIESFGAFGNVSSASIPAAMAYELGKTLTGEEQHRVILSGFGVGLSWASCLLSLKAIKCLKWFEYADNFHKKS